MGNNMQRNIYEELNAVGDGVVSGEKKLWAFIVRNKFMLSKLAGVILGIVLGLILMFTTKMKEKHIMLLKLPGDVLMSMLKTVSVPLLVTSVTIGVAGLEVNTAMKIARRASVFFITTTILAIINGLVLVLLINPGAAHAVYPDHLGKDPNVDVVDAVLDLFRNMMPDNLLTACFQTYQTEVVFYDADGKPTLEENGTIERHEGSYIPRSNTLGLIIWSFIIGICLRTLGPAGKQTIDLITVLNDTMKKVVNFILCYLPIGVTALLATHIAEVHDWDMTRKLGTFILAVILGLFIHAVIVLPLIYLFFIKQNPFFVIKRMAPALLTALLISSSSATLPITLQMCESGLHIDKRVSRFILPVGTSVNKDGTALYEVVAAIFIAQLNYIRLSVGKLFTVCVTSTIISIASPSIPATGAVTTMVVVTSVGLHTQDATLLVAVEWMLDRCCTMVNVLGDCFGTELICELMKKEFNKSDAAEEEVMLSCSDFWDMNTAPESKDSSFEDAREPSQSETENT